MARIESVATGGYFPTPLHLVPWIASRIHPVQAREKSSWDRLTLSVLDPCAGEGAAVLELLKHIHSPTYNLYGVSLALYTCELEATRHEHLEEAVSRISWNLRKDCLHGDAFHTTFEKKDYYGTHYGVSLLYLNPPYDTDRVHGRLEQRFLDRFTPTLASGGLLVFVVPFHALKASAELLGRSFSDVRCFRFPEPDFQAYKQVVLYACRDEERIEPDRRIVDQVLQWANDPTTIPEFLKDEEPTYSLPQTTSGLRSWKIHSVDLQTLKRKVRPWHSSNKSGTILPIAGILPMDPVQNLLLRTYPVATPPRPAHIAAGIASGIYNGQAITPNDPNPNRLPKLLIKGVFSREYRTIEEKKGKDGEVKGLVQVQQPKLIITVLNLETSIYHKLSAGTEATGSSTIETMNVADLLIHYRDSLMGVMERQCPVLYDPRRDADSIPLPEFPRKLFTAQAHAVRALVKLMGGPGLPLRKRRGKSPFLLGEIGCGKSSVALATTQTIRAHRILIMCPPHLLRSWQNEIAAITPQANVRVLSTVEDLQDASQVSSSPENPLICILSREAAKLAHGWENVGSACPKCGAPTPKGVDFAKKHARCEVKALIAGDDLFREAQKLALHLQPFDPEAVESILRGRFDCTRKDLYLNRQKTLSFGGLDPSFVDPAIRMLMDRMAQRHSEENLIHAILRLMVASWSEDRVISLAREALASENLKPLGRALVLLLPPGHPAQRSLQEEDKEPSVYNYPFGWTQIFQVTAELIKNPRTQYPFPLSWEDGKLSLFELPARSLKAAHKALHTMATLGKHSWGKECGEFLFGAVPEPRRVSLAKHITRYYKGLFDFLILDEVHEYGTDGSAQERSAHRLTKLGVPTINMTGSVMNGYAASLFPNMWAASNKFREEYDHDQMQKYIDRYGYRKRLIEDKDEEGEVIEFGSQSDRITRSERFIGNAPGILPLFLLEHLLPVSVTLHKSDLSIDLPRCVQECHRVKPTQELKDRYEKLKDSLVGQIRKDMFDEELSGKLFGQLSELPSYLDRSTSDTGNTEIGDYEIRYPESLKNKVVATQPGFSPNTVSPKERWMLDLVEKELEEGRNVMVFSWHVTLLPRMARLLADCIGDKVPILYADKVQTGKRQDWIDREVIKKNRRVLVTNPVAIQTGLNNLVHFCTQVWMENPACNPITYRQAIGRIDRIGQTRESRVFSAIYDGTLQVEAYDLLMKKVAVSVSTDGLDPESALQAAGLGEPDYLAGLSIGKQLWRMCGGFGTDLAA